MKCKANTIWLQITGPTITSYACPRCIDTQLKSSKWKVTNEIAPTNRKAVLLGQKKKKNVLWLGIVFDLVRSRFHYFSPYSQCVIDINKQK